MGFRFCSLSSGSDGNCQYIETDNSRIIIDAGFSGKKIEGFLNSIGVCPTTLDAIFITHEHIDHIRGAGVLSRRYDLPIYANEKTWIGMKSKIGDIEDKNVNIIYTGRDFEFQDMYIHPVAVFHDALEPVGYIINHKRSKISIITDTGYVCDDIIDEIKGSQLYLMESNHDEFMLKEGLYPWYLKQRIMSNEGHLSNDDAGKILGNVLTGNGEVVLLAHLSKDNNVPELALDTVKTSLYNQGINVDRDMVLSLSHRDRPTEVYTL